jgi:hypothetical protein
MGLVVALRALRERLVTVVTTLRSDINAGNTRDCQAAVEEVGESLLRVYHIQRESFLPSAKAMITTIVAVILALLLVTKLGGLVESLITLAFLSFFLLTCCGC